MTGQTPETLLTLTADIVAAHVSNNRVGLNEITGLISSVHGSLAGLGAAQVEPEEEALKPVVSVRSSVKPDKLTCLTCGQKFATLKRHLRVEHDQTAEQYRAQWKLPADYPMVAPNYSEMRRNMAKELGLGRKMQQGAVKRRAARKA